MKLTNEELIKIIIDRLKGILDENMAGDIYQASNITLKENGEIILNGNTNIILDNLLASLLKKGTIPVKITLRNLARDYDLNICPLCKDINATKFFCDEADNKDISVNVLYSDSAKKILRISLKNGALLDEHAANCPIMVLCISGNGVFETSDRLETLREGALINLGANIVHKIRAKDKVEVLVTKYIAA